MRGELPVENSGEKKPRPDLIVIEDYGPKIPIIGGLHHLGIVKSEGKVLYRTDNLRATADEIKQLPVIKKNVS